MPTQIPQPQPTTDKNKKGQEQEQKPGQSKPNQQTQGDKSQQKPQNPANPIERDTQFDKGQKQNVQGQTQGEFEPYDARRKTQPIEDVDLGGVDGKENMSEQPGAFRTAGTQGPGNSKIDRNTMSDQPGALRNKDTE